MKDKDDIISHLMKWCKNLYWEDLISKIKSQYNIEGVKLIHKYWNIAFEVSDNCINQLKSKKMMLMIVKNNY